MTEPDSNPPATALDPAPTPVDPPLDQPKPTLAPPRRGRHPSNTNAPRTGKHHCKRCGWRWNTAEGRPDPPHCCARCHTSYWDTKPQISRFNKPDDPKWVVDWETLRKQRRRAYVVKRFRQLAAELGDEALAICAPTLKDHLAAEKIARDERLRKESADLAAKAAEESERGLTPIDKPSTPSLIPPPPGWTPPGAAD